MIKTRMRLGLIALCSALAASCAPPSTPVPPAPALCATTSTAAEPATTLAVLTAKATEQGAVRVIVRLAANPAASGEETAANAQAAFAQAGVPGAQMLSPRLPFMVAELTPAQLQTLANDPHFDGWTEDRIALPTLAQSGPLVEAPQLWAIGGRGAGQAVAILDTGVDSAHPFVNGRVATEACFSTSSAANNSQSVCPNGQSAQIGAGAARPCNVQGCEHGTHVAGIAAGRGADFSGMAPDADIIAVQVFSRFSGAACGGGGSCVASFTSDQIRALDYVLQLAGQRAVASANLSLGGGRATSACDDDMTKPVIDQLRAAGIATVIASGNDGFRDAVSFPGCISSAITVGASSKQDQVASFSNCGPQLDLMAPGVSITSSIPTDRFAPFSGTSMATPHVAGAFAALRSLAPRASVDQIEAALKSTGRDVGGRPRIQLLAAARALGVAASTESAMVQSASDNPALQTAVAELASLPPNQPVRLIVGVAAPVGAQGQALDAAIARAETAARQAGVSTVSRLGAQPMLVIEATPAQARALAQSGAVSSIQADTPARTQN